MINQVQVTCYAPSKCNRLIEQSSTQKAHEAGGDALEVYGEAALTSGAPLRRDVPARAIIARVSLKLEAKRILGH